MKLLNYLLFFGSSSFFKSIKLLLYLKSKTKTDILFYYPSYLSQKSKLPTFLVPLITSVKKNNLSYLVIEEPNLNQKLSRSKEATPFDFLWLLIILLRKFHTGNNYNLIDIKITNLVGEIIYSNILNKFSGTYNQSIDLRIYSKGVYLFELNTENGSINKKLILQ